VRLNGIIVPIVTPFKTDYSLDLRRFASLIDDLIKKGVNGIFPLGTNGEFALLNEEEKESLIREAVSASAGKVPVLAGVSDPGTRNAVANAKLAEKLGADFVVATPPYYYKVSDEGILSHFRALCSSVSIPVLMYHIPSNTGNDVSVKYLKRISNLDNMAGIKYTTRDFPAYLEVLHATQSSSFSVFMGTDMLIYSALVAGSDGVVTGLANVAPDECVRIHERIKAGDLASAWKIQESVFPVAQAMFVGDFPAAVKGMMAVRGNPSGPVRPPLARLTASQENTLRKAVSDSGLLPKRHARGFNRPG
jgi:4-hydroxy-tetrahydrodipicolinate synthase/2-dehydro-3-deoxy-phosphogluconate/2-dehydro-3-deoxy-6-phosphogalactonate aldolase